tara:strand:+ start:6016 stop:8754 length:2739 start_codon:yes stop_codon:yes gene_type:complete
MAIEFARVQFISRGKGHSVVAASAYRSAQKIQDEKLGVTHDYERKQGVVHNEVMLPEEANNAFMDCGVLWNAVEEFESRKNSQLARELVIALPSDESVSDEDRIELTRRFVSHHFIQHGLAAQISIHEPHDGGNNIHAHILVTTRRLKANSFEKKKARDLLPEVRGGQVIKEDKIWKDYWREMQDAYFQEKGLGIEVDPTGIISEVHVGKNAKYNLNQTDNEKILENKARKKQAKEIVLTNPVKLLQLLTSKESVFTEIDLYKTIHRHTDSQEEYDIALKAVQASKNLITLGKNANGRECFTTKEMFELECGLQESACQLKKRKTFQVGQKYADKVVSKNGLSDEQARAVKDIVHGDNISIVVGHAGTGKSYAMKTANEIWAGCGYDVMGLCFAKKAATNLELESNIKSRTIHSFLYGVEQNKISIDKNTILVVDEAGMVNALLLKDVLAKAKKVKAKVVLVGDPKQLQPIGPGGPFRAFTESIGFAELTNIRRQKVEWQKQASLDFAAQRTSKAFSQYDKHQRVELKETANDAFDKIATRYFDDKKQGKDTAILAAKNVEVDSLNAAVRSVLMQAGEIGEEHSFTTQKGEKYFSVGDCVILLKNDTRLSVSNGDIGKVVAANKNKLEIKLDNKQENIFVSASQYNHISHGYATTVYKAQGSTFDKAHVYLGNWGWNKQTAYVAFTRHREDLSIYASKEDFANHSAISNKMNRSGLKDSVLDFPLAFAKRRGLASEALEKSCVKKVTEKMANILSGIQLKAQERRLKGEQSQQKGARAEQEKKESSLLIQAGERKRVVVITDTIESAKVISELNPDKTVWVASQAINAEAVFKGFRVKPDVMLVSTKENQQDWVQKNVKNASTHVRRAAHLHEKQSLQKLVSLQGEAALKQRMKKAKSIHLSQKIEAELSIH